ncbi:MAG: chemotaxis response regulator protein-glutamate methylesterase [Spirochaetota bacterium]
MSLKRIRIFIIDDQTVVREILKKMFSTDSECEVVGEAGDPYEASQLIPDLTPDVLTLDIEMPRMNGVEFLRKLMPQYPIPVIMLTSTSERGSEQAIQAMAYGAVDFITKPDGLDSLQSMQTILLAKVKAAAKVKIHQHFQQSRFRKTTLPTSLAVSSHKKYKYVAIGASTGGVTAIRSILAQIPQNFPPILIVQHMPKGFTKTFAASLQREFGLVTREAENLEVLQNNRVYVAPGNFHMTLKYAVGNFVIHLDSTEKINGHRPSVDVLFASIAKTGFAADFLGIILTGMGSDGANGLLAMSKAGAKTLGQDQESSLIYGMPRVAFEQGAVQEQIALAEVATKMRYYLQHPHEV